MAVFHMLFVGSVSSSRGHRSYYLRKQQQHSSGASSSPWTVPFASNWMAGPFQTTNLQSSAYQLSPVSCCSPPPLQTVSVSVCILHLATVDSATPYLLWLMCFLLYWTKKFLLSATINFSHFVQSDSSPGQYTRVLIRRWCNRNRAL